MGAPKVIRIGDFEVEPHYLRFVEAELRKHPHRKRRLRDLEDDIIRSTSEEDNTGMPRGTNVGNPTLSKALALMKDEQRSHLQMQVRRIEEVYQTLGPLQREIVRHLYFENRLTTEGTIQVVSTSRRDFFRQRNRALLAFILSIVGEHAVWH